MKLKKFNQLFEREGFDDIYSTFDYEDDYDSTGLEDKYKKFDKGEEDDDYEGEDDDMSHLCYLLRSMFKNSNIDVNVENRGLDLSITTQFAIRETLGDVVKLFEVVKKIKNDILAQYSSTYEMWENKLGNPMITFEFILVDEDVDVDENDGDFIFTDYNY